VICKIEQPDTAKMLVEKEIKPQDHPITNK